MADAVAAAIKQIAQRKSLTAAESAAAFNEIMQGSASAAQIAALLIGLRVKGESAEEVAGAAQALRAAMIRVDAPSPESLVDTCGTGGGVVGTFNISTAAAFTAAGAGVRIAKHGNRSFTSKCGSADVLEALGIGIELQVERLAGVLAEAGMVFMFAPTMHPAMRHVGPVRRELGVPTVMNIVGPLANPASAGRQVVGVADRARLPLIAEALQRLGSVHALVVHGEPGLDELSPLGPSTVLEIRKGVITEWVLDPASHDLHSPHADHLAGGTPADNAALIETIVNGGGPSGARSAVLLNAAAAIYVGAGAPDFRTAISAARDSLDAGRAREALDKLRRATK
ncbi:MAG TPA: anthranilate phosphoribosyltransferase [Gemmatimonadaceae bacterium]|nr:anthranilate phosphoribosyltransferase [Gemmatimonadaceae bacterium]